jgi:hypothetical protein
VPSRFAIAEPLTDHIATQWHRFPEVLFGIDMLATCSILAELVGRHSLFPCGLTVEQLERIVSNTGLPSKIDIESMSR